jgi:hypothetical protein
MKAFVRRKRALDSLTSIHREDPLSGVANLFDASIVFAVGLMVALIELFGLTQFFDPNSQLTIMQKDMTTGQVALIEKNHPEIKIKKMTQEKKGGPGPPAWGGISTTGGKCCLCSGQSRRAKAIAAPMMLLAPHQLGCKASRSSLNREFPEVKKLNGIPLPDCPWQVLLNWTYGAALVLRLPHSNPELLSVVPNIITNC